MKKNGFTLVELIISIALLSLIGISIGITLNKSFKKNQNNEYDEFINKVVSSANTYASSDTNIINQLETNKGFIDIKASDLINSGILSTDLVNPNTGSKITGEEIIRITLDDNGTLKFDFNPSEAEDYLIARSIIVKQGTSIDSVFYCNYGINTNNLKYVDSNGDSTYKLDDTNLKCTLPEIKRDKDNTLIEGTYIIKYSYKTIAGIWKSANRKLLITDGKPPIINLSNTPIYYSQKVNINISLKDESGLKEYCLTTNSDCNCQYNKSSNKKADVIDLPVYNNNLYYVCASDIFDNRAKESITITNVDVTAPTITIDSTTPNTLTNGNVKISFTIKDDLSGVAGYYVTTSLSKPVTISPNVCSGHSCNINASGSYPATSNGTYYIYAIDDAGNISAGTKYDINNIDKTPPQFLNVSWDYQCLEGYTTASPSFISSESLSSMQFYYGNSSYQPYNNQWNNYINSVSCDEFNYFWVKLIDTAGNSSVKKLGASYCSCPQVIEPDPYIPTPEPDPGYSGGGSSTTASYCDSGSKYYLNMAQVYWCTIGYDDIPTTNGKCKSGFFKNDIGTCCSNTTIYNANIYWNLDSPCYKDTGQPKCPSGTSLSADNNTCKG